VPPGFLRECAAPLSVGTPEPILRRGRLPSALQITYFVLMAILAQTRFRRVRTHVPASLRVQKRAPGKFLSHWPEGRYEPYGRLEGYAGNRISRYTWGAGGKEFVEELGWVDFGRRLYDPTVGAWTARDPMGQYASFYRGSNNPLNGVDPDGSVWITISKVTSGGFLNAINAVFSGFDEGQDVVGIRTIGFNFENVFDTRVRTLTQMWIHDPNAPDTWNHLHPSGTIRQIPQVMMDRDVVLKAYMERTGAKAVLINWEDKSTRWFPEIDNETYEEFGAIPLVRGNEVIPFNQHSNPTVTPGDLECIGCED